MVTPASSGAVVGEAWANPRLPDGEVRCLVREARLELEARFFTSGHRRMVESYASACRTVWSRGRERDWVWREVLDGSRADRDALGAAVVVQVLGLPGVPLPVLLEAWRWSSRGRSVHHGDVGSMAFSLTRWLLGLPGCPAEVLWWAALHPNEAVRRLVAEAPDAPEECRVAAGLTFDLSV